MTAFRKTLRIVLPIMIGTAIYAFALHMFVIPNQLMEGGITGIAILLNYAFHWAPSITTLLINIPLFYIGWRVFGGKAMVYTIWGTLSLSFFLWLMEIIMGHGWIKPFRTEHDYLLAALYAGAAIGLGLGIVFRFGGTTGGSDILARIGYKKRGWSMGQVLLFIDAAVIGLSVLYIPFEKILYTLVTVFIASKVIDFIQEGVYAARACTIITDHGTEMADSVLNEIDRGVTIFPARGAYSKVPKEVVYCVVARQEIRRLKYVIRQIDPYAFIIINEVQDVLGEGFRNDQD